MTCARSRTASASRFGSRATTRSGVSRSRSRSTTWRPMLLVGAVRVITRKSLRLFCVAGSFAVDQLAQEGLHRSWLSAEQGVEHLTVARGQADTVVVGHHP